MNTMIYYINHNACPDLESAAEIQQLYLAVGVEVDILPEAEYFSQLELESL